MRGFEKYFNLFIDLSSIMVNLLKNMPKSVVRLLEIGLKSCDFKYS